MQCTLENVGHSDGFPWPHPKWLGCRKNETTSSWFFEAAGGRDVLVGGGAATVRQYLRVSLIDELHLAIVPVLLGAGERLFDDLGPSTRVTGASNTYVRQP